MGFFGGLVMSAIKRDRGVKDWGHMIEGHGGMLDRLDSVVFAAPIFFHLTRYAMGGMIRRPTRRGWRRGRGFRGRVMESDCDGSREVAMSIDTRGSPPIARGSWRGRTRRERADEYEAYNYEAGIKPLIAAALGVETFREDRAGRDRVHDHLALGER